tara:strand:+ start:1671 stop:2942 length:1272 start_codon:yes stop_codon:yes gene_type:complete
MAYRAKGFNLPERIVFTHSKGTTDITGSYTKIIVEEDIFNPSISMSIAIADSTGALDDIDFDGTETVKLSFNSSKPDDNTINLLFRVYKVTVAPAEDGTNNKAYFLYGVTPEHFTQAIMDINQSFNVPLNEAAKVILDKVNNNTTRKKKRKLNFHETTGTYTYIIPGMTPYESMDFLCKRSYDATFTSSLFTFYENNKGYNFHNIERLIKDERDEVINYTYNAQVNTNDDEIDHQHELMSIEFKPTKNVMDRIKSGAYASQVAEINLIDQTLDRRALLVKDNFKDFVHTDKKAMSLDSKDMIDDSLNVINSTYWKNSCGVNDNIADIVPRRKFYMDSLATVEMTCVAPGDSNLAVGKMIGLSMLEQNVKNQTKQQEPKVTGKYLVTRLIHTLTREDYVMSMTCNKDSFRTNVKDPKKNIVAEK